MTPDAGGAPNGQISSLYRQMDTNHREVMGAIGKLATRMSVVETRLERQGVIEAELAAHSERLREVEKREDERKGEAKATDRLTAKQKTTVGVVATITSAVVYLVGVVVDKLPF